MNREDMRKLFASSEGGAAETPAEQPEASAEAPASYREVGMARLDGMRNTVSGWQTKFDAMKKSFGEKAGRFSANAQKFGMDSVASTLGAVEVGAQRTGAAISAGVEAAEEGAIRFNAGFQNVGTAVERGMSAGADAASAWAGRFAQGTANITEMLAIGAKNKTEEALSGAADAIGTGYNNVRQYGSEAVEMAKFGWRSLKERASAKMNEIALRHLEQKEQFHSAEVIKLKDAIAKKKGLADSVNQEFAIAA